MDEKLAKIWEWHHNLQSVLNDIREAQALIEFIIHIDNLITEADSLDDSIEQELKNKLD